ncbi:hypothetical protein SLA2020_266720 [Shorea laevis]
MKKVLLYGVNERCIVISNSKKPTSAISLLKLEAFMTTIFENDFEATDATHLALCGLLMRKGHKCPHCVNRSLENRSRGSNNCGLEGDLNLMNE